MKRILTIQDISCVGQCSLTVALPVISACGVETAILPSSVLSTHTGGFSRPTFRDLTEDMPAIEAHWNKEGLTFDAFYTGYVSPSQIPYIRHIMDSCAAPGAVRIVDPVMADNGRLYSGFAQDFPSQIAQLCHGADYILPNLTEAALLLGRAPVLSGYDRAYIDELVRALWEKLQVGHVILTGVSFNDDELGTAIYDGRQTAYVMAQKQSRMAHGTGDIYASTFTGCLMRGLDSMTSAHIAAEFVCACIKATDENHRYGVSFERAIPVLVRMLAEAID